MANRGRPSANKKVENMYNEDEDFNSLDENLETGNELEVDEAEIVDTSKNETTDSNSVGNSYNPFSENVIKREYSSPPIADNITNEIEEPSFRPPSYDDIMTERSSAENEKITENNPFLNPNPVVNEMDSQDQKIACEMLVDTCLDGYEQLHQLAQWSAKVDEQDLMEKQMQGKIDLQTQKIPISEDGEEVTLGEFLNTYNEQCTEALSYDKSFGEKVRPAMIRVFTKNGWGMSDGQYLAFMFGKDIVTKTSIVYSLKKSLNMTMTMIEKQYKIYKKENNITDKSSIKVDDDLELYESEDIENDYYEPVVQPKPKPKAKPKAKAKAKPKSKTSKKFKIDYPNQPKDTLSQHPKEIQNEIIKGK
jgi:hypothetical protein